eukprot:TRINITY_DN4908_c0_g1_i3.p1 TRINITY_DN4908_c0_g1~~TRINITY_DN4908_c0_g1_i3.p1  ORF type:complete len:491 (-),score=35.62 TRINITY_DN4908_c0_g1_i3:139-1611(-)
MKNSQFLSDFTDFVNSEDQILFPSSDTINTLAFVVRENITNVSPTTSTTSTTNISPTTPTANISPTTPTYRFHLVFLQRTTGTLLGSLALVTSPSADLLKSDPISGTKRLLLFEDILFVTTPSSLMAVRFPTTPTDFGNVTSLMMWNVDVVSRQIGSRVLTPVLVDVAQRMVFALIRDVSGCVVLVYVEMRSGRVLGHVCLLPEDRPSLGFTAMFDSSRREIYLYLGARSASLVRFNSPSNTTSFTPQLLSRFSLRSTLPDPEGLVSLILDSSLFTPTHAMLVAVASSGQSVGFYLNFTSPSVSLSPAWKVAYPPLYSFVVRLSFFAFNQSVVLHTGSGIMVIDVVTGGLIWSCTHSDLLALRPPNLKCDSILTDHKLALEMPVGSAVIGSIGSVPPPHPLTLYTFVMRVAYSCEPQTYPFEQNVLLGIRYAARDEPSGIVLSTQIVGWEIALIVVASLVVVLALWKQFGSRLQSMWQSQNDAVYVQVRT